MNIFNYSEYLMSHLRFNRKFAISQYCDPVQAQRDIKASKELITKKLYLNQN